MRELPDGPAAVVLVLATVGLGTVVSLAVYLCQHVTIGWAQ